MWEERIRPYDDGIHCEYTVLFYDRPVYTIPVKGDMFDPDTLERARDYFASNLTLSLKRGFF